GGGGGRGGGGGASWLGGAPPFYRSYECADGRYVAVGALEPRFSAELLDRLGVAPDDDMRRRWYDPAAWPELRSAMADLFRTRTRDEWCALLEGTDACVAPVLSLGEAPAHRHNAARGTFTTVAGGVQPSPAPRFSAPPSSIAAPPPAAGQHAADIRRARRSGGRDNPDLRGA